ncbi:large ribosomal subunit protein mL50-like [Tubulanus polymorphus]|uniref:large ribosomal subunit protein mL50-like n=1 Tax=Tubulanus polymorphus TaxID=672921 RepID=UPI003DA31CAE
MQSIRNISKYCSDFSRFQVIYATSKRTAFWSRKAKNDDDNKEEMDAAVESVVQKRKRGVEGGDSETQLQRIKTLRSRASVRTQKIAYKPPENAEQLIESIVTESLGSTDDNWKTLSLENPSIKYKILTKCMQQLNHYVPNSYMSDLKTIQDVVNFFQIEVRDTAPIEDLSRLDLPKNLHVQMDYKFFNPDTDTMHGGIPAHPKQDFVIRGLKDKKLYKGYKAKKHWHEYKNALPPKEEYFET